MHIIRKVVAELSGRSCNCRRAKGPSCDFAWRNRRFGHALI